VADEFSEQFSLCAGATCRQAAGCGTVNPRDNDGMASVPRMLRNAPAHGSRLCGALHAASRPGHEKIAIDDILRTRGNFPVGSGAAVFWAFQTKV
jgi:hypothetical protein